MDYLWLIFVFVAQPLYGRDMSVSDFLPDFADVDVDRTVADNHRIAPDTGVDLFPGEEFFREKEASRASRANSLRAVRYALRRGLPDVVPGR